MLKKELEKQNKYLKEKVDYLEEGNKKLVMEAMEAGEHLKDEIFIPEYLGFQEFEVEDKETHVTMSRVYSKDKFNITRLPDNSWIIMLPLKKGQVERQKNILMFENMYEAILGLKMCGMNISIKTLTESTDTIDEINERLGINLENVTVVN